MMKQRLNQNKSITWMINSSNPGFSGYICVQLLCWIKKINKSISKKTKMNTYNMLLLFSSFISFDPLCQEVTLTELEDVIKKDPEFRSLLKDLREAKEQKYLP